MGVSVDERKTSKKGNKSLGGKNLLHHLEGGVVSNDLLLHLLVFSRAHVDGGVVSGRELRFIHAGRSFRLKRLRRACCT